MSHHNYRRFFGLLLGALTGLIYGLVSQSLNHLFLPGIPLYHPPLGLFGNLVLCVLIGAALGLLDAWPETGVRGVLWSSILSTIIVSAAILMTGKTGSQVMTLKITAVVAMLLPVIGFLAPFMIIFHWIVSREENAYREKQAGFDMPIVPRVAVPLILLLVTIWIGSGSWLNDSAKASLPRMQALIQQGQAAVNAHTALPDPLRSERVTQFTQRGLGSYTLQWDRDEDNRYAIPRLAGPDQSTVIAHYDSGYLLVCVFAGPQLPPECRDF